MKFFKPFLKRKDRKLGVAEHRRHYDLPLNKDAGAGFLTLLIALMTFLAVMALTGAFTLQGVADRWSSGLENKATIEVPVEKENGDLRSPADIEAILEKIEAVLKRSDAVQGYEILSEEDIQGLIEPWLGAQAASLSDIPLPGLVSVVLHDDNPQSFENFQKQILKIDSNIHIDTHQKWLGDILKLTGALQIAALIITLIITITTITAIAGGIRSRLAIHKADVELLHLMGARDSYIGKQFQRHALIMTLQGSGAGLISGLLIIGAFSLFTYLATDQASGILPKLTLSVPQVLLLLALPLGACLIAALTARITVQRVLAMMP